MTNDISILQLTTHYQVLIFLRDTVEEMQFSENCNQSNPTTLNSLLANQEEMNS